jgi:hypothetical protein
MKKNEVKINAVYLVKVSGQITLVKLVMESRYGGWDGTNLVTGRAVWIRTTARLRREIPADKVDELLTTFLRTKETLFILSK